VVAARIEGEWLILDNRTFVLVRDTNLTRAVPKLVLDQEGVRRFILRGRPDGSAAEPGGLALRKRS
jgi:hypothetical protein